MKIIFISNTDEIITPFTIFSEKLGIDLITYRSFIKALDNIQEIKPDYVIINTSEYPRQWKLLAQFLKSDITCKNTQIILFEQERMSDEDYDKSQLLEVAGFFNSVDDEGLNQFKELLKFENKIVDEMELSSITDKVLFNHPDNGQLIFGTSEKITDLCYKITTSEKYNFSRQSIKNFTFKNGESVNCMITKVFENQPVFEIVKE